MPKSPKQFQLPLAYTREHAITLAGSVNMIETFDVSLGDHTGTHFGRDLVALRRLSQSITDSIRPNTVLSRRNLLVSQCHLIEEYFAWHDPFDVSGGLFHFFSYASLSTAPCPFVWFFQQSSSPCVYMVPKNEISD